MIPGPVTGHIPVDPGGTQRQLTEPLGEAGADAGTSFADLLAAMLAPGAAGAQLQAPAPTQAEAVFERLDAAEVFNETGLFRGAAPLPLAEAAKAVASAAVAASEPADGPSAAPGPGPQADFDAAPSLRLASAVPALDEVASTTRQAAANSGGAVSSGSGAGSASKAVHGTASPTLHGAAASIRANPSESAAAGPEAAGGGRASPRTVALVAQLLAAKAGTAAAQVSVQAAEGGISVMARVDRLSREERDRLRGEIGELLARHGFGSAEIMLNGEAWPLPQGKED